MSDDQTIMNPETPIVESKKRKRTGKDRKEAKAAAEQAQARMAEIIAAAKVEPEIFVEDPVEDVKSGVNATINPDAQAKAEAAAAAALAKAEAAAAKKLPENIAKRIPQGLKAIHPLLKQAKTFETQRLIKKVRYARTKEQDVSDMEAQIAALSDIQLHDLALSHLRTKISKHHTFKHSPLPKPIAEALDCPSNPASTSAIAAEKSKAENRLISAKVVADGMKDILGWVLGEPGARLVSRPMAMKEVKDKMKGKGMDLGRKRMLEAVAGSQDDEDSEDEGEDDEEIDRGYGEMVDSGDEEEWDLDSGSEDDGEGEGGDGAGWESGSVDDLDISGDNEGESDDLDAIPIPKRTKAEKSKSLPLKSKAPLAPTPKPVKPTKSAKAPKTSNKREDITSSLFLPSLASGFTRGDSDDSDPDLDFDNDGSGTVGKQGTERKNRRGQRARQAIWEKKFGKNAKHVIKAQEADNVAQSESNIKNAYGKRSITSGPTVPTNTITTSSPASRPVPTRGPPSSSTTGFGKPFTPTPRPIPSIAPAPVTAPGAGGQGLHPSWEAARRKKQLLANAPAAQKIVFD